MAARGVLVHGFARLRCDACAHERLLVFWYMGRTFCPSCHPTRLSIWTEWLNTTRLSRSCASHRVAL